MNVDPCEVAEDGLQESTGGIRRIAKNATGASAKQGHGVPAAHA
jgi:hypothetical protein